MEPTQDIGFQVNRLSHLIRHGASRSDTPAPGIQGWIIGYLYRNRERDVFQRDVQSHFSLRRSTVTGILQQMEKNGLITRSSVPFDARLKKLELTPKAMKIHEQVMSDIRRTEDLLSATLTPQEKQTFLELCDKIRLGLESRRDLPADTP